MALVPSSGRGGVAGFNSSTLTLHLLNSWVVLRTFVTPLHTMFPSGAIDVNVFSLRMFFSLVAMAPTIAQLTLHSNPTS